MHATVVHETITKAFEGGTDVEVNAVKAQAPTIRSGTYG